MTALTPWPIDTAPVDFNPQFARALRQRLAAQGAVIVRNLPLHRLLFEQVAQAIATHALLDASLDSSNAEEPAELLDQPDLPLHTEGVIAQRSVDATVWHATHAAEGPAGALHLSYQAQAMAHLPPDLLEVLREHGLIYHVLNHTRFPDAPETWFEIPCLRKVQGHERMYLALPFAPQHKALWEVRVNGWAPSTSQDFLARLQAQLQRTAVHHVHQWQAGDLVVVDHRAVLHGFTATAEDQPIHCMRQDIALQHAKA